MASSIQSTNTGSTYIAGAFSGIDSAAIIRNAVEARLAPKRNLDTQISTNLNKITSFQTLRTQGEQVKTIFDRLKSDLLGNVFSGKQPTYSSSSAIPASNLLTATLTKDALPGNNSVVVKQVAKTFSTVGTDQTSVTNALGLTGSFTIGQAGKTPATISIASTDTIQSLRNKINATSATSGVSADILQVSPGVYRLVIRGSESAQPVSVTGITGDNVLEALGVTDSAGAFSTDPARTQEAKPAIINLNGVDVSSNTNRFENVLTGVTIDVTGADPLTTITIKVGNNVDGVKTAIQDMVDGYNAIRQTIATNQALNADGSLAEGANLYGEYLNSSLGVRMGQIISGTYGTGLYNGLRSLGISINSSNELVIDSSALNNALTNNYDDVRSVFETQGNAIGLADAMSALVGEYSNFVTGSIQTEIKALQTVNSGLSKKSDEIQASVNQYQSELIIRYATLEAKMKMADTMKKQILAIMDANRTN